MDSNQTKIIELLREVHLIEFKREGAAHQPRRLRIDPGFGASGIATLIAAG
jgi:hypothetical protein